MFVKIFLGLPALLLVLSGSEALEGDVVVKAVNQCLSKTDEKIDLVHMFELPRTPGEKCVAVCLVGALKMLNDDGSFNADVFHDFLIATFGQPEKMAKIGAECMKTPPKIDLNNCESLNSMISCFDVEANKIALDRKILLKF